MSEIQVPENAIYSEDEKFILSRHTVVQQSMAIWTGVSLALVFSYAGALFTFLNQEPLSIRLFAFLLFAIAYSGVFSGTVTIGQTLVRHMSELRLLKETRGISSLGEWYLGRAKASGKLNAMLSVITTTAFSAGLLLATIFYGS